MSFSETFFFVSHPTRGELVARHVSKAIGYTEHVKEASESIRRGL